MGAISSAIIANCAPLVRLFPCQAPPPDSGLTPSPYAPCSVDWYLSQVELCYQLNGSTVVYLEPPITEQQLGGSLPTPPTPQGYFLRIPNDPSASSPVRLGQGPSAPVYVHVRNVSDLCSANVYYDLQYWFFYAVRGMSTLRILPFVTSEEDYDLVGPHAASGQYTDGYQGKGEHQGDWKHISVRIDPDGNIQEVYYAQHNTGMWVQNDQIQFVGGHPVVYSARNTHSCFPAAGKTNQDNFDKTIDGKFGISLLEWAADGGVEWPTWQNVILIGDDTDPSFVPPPWLGFGGNWGPSEEQVVSPNVPSPVKECISWVSSFIENPLNGPSTPSFQGPWRTGDFDPFNIPIAEVVSAPSPWPPGQDSRSSGNFSTKYLPPGTTSFQVVVDSSDPAPVFAIKKDTSGKDPTPFPVVKNGMFLSPTSEDSLYIARVQGATSCFTVRLLPSRQPPSTG